MQWLELAVKHYDSRASHLSCPLDFSDINRVHLYQAQLHDSIVTILNLHQRRRNNCLFYPLDSYTVVNKSMYLPS